MQHRYVIIAGHGRSGSNRMLDIFNQHQRSWCRNEPNEVAGSALADLPDGFFLDGLPANFVMQWRTQRHIAASRFSYRDRLPTFAKQWHGHRAAPRIGAEILRRNRLRGLIGRGRPLGADEWVPPALYAAPDATTVPVLKILLQQGWLVRTHGHDQGQVVVHNIRAPERFIRSWRGRYVEDVGAAHVYADSLPYLDRIMEHFGERPWTDQAGDRGFSEANLIESELWRWRYVNETMFTRLNHSPRYMVATYDEVSRDPVTVAKRAYALAGLDFDVVHETRITALKNELFGVPANPVAIDIAMLTDRVARVLDGSPLVPLLSGERRSIATPGKAADVAVTLQRAS